MKNQTSLDKYISLTCRLLFIAFISLILGACKVSISAGDGGSVHLGSETGSACEPCNIDTIDANGEAYVAVAQSGFEFDHWDGATSYCTEEEGLVCTIEKFGPIGIPLLDEFNGLKLTALFIVSDESDPIATPIPTPPPALFTEESVWPPTDANEIAFIYDDEFVLYDLPTLDHEGDRDWWSFKGRGKTFFFYIKTGDDHQANDTTKMSCHGQVFDQDGNYAGLASAFFIDFLDDGFHSNCELEFTPPDDKTYYLRVRARDGYPTKTGAYTLVVTKDDNTVYSTSTNQSFSYVFEGKVLRRRFSFERVFTMPINILPPITTCEIIFESYHLYTPEEKLECTFIVRTLDVEQVLILNHVTEFVVEVYFPWSYNIDYDWISLPRFKVTITNSDPLPHIDDLK